jgi:5-methylcytosine-specific restriction endonuclease McrA
MPRLHKTTHPVLGLVTWAEMVNFRDTLRTAGKRVCTWCHEEVPEGLRTRCGKAECREKIWQAQSWGRCAKVALRRNRLCQGKLIERTGNSIRTRLCGKRALEVDHIVPVSLGGSGDQSNLRCLCHECHLAATNALRKYKSEYAVA